MRFLRTTSTARLLALVLGVIVAAAATAAIALAATSNSGTKPPPKPLAQAIHDAVTAPQVDGVSARIKFTNHLVDSSAVVGSSPLLSGASGRLWASSDGKLRIELQSTNGDAQIVSDGKSFLVYDGGSNTAYTGDIPQHQDKQDKHAGTPPSTAKIQKGINHARQHASVSGAIPTTVAGQSAYQVRVSPQHGGLLSAATFAWDAVRGIPLKVAIYAKGDSSPVLALTAKSISYGKVPTSVFDITPPKGAHVVNLTGNSGGNSNGSGPQNKTLPFKINAPDTLGGMSRTQIQHKGDGALITYGQGLDGLAVFEKQADPQQSQQQPAGHDLQLPTVDLGGTQGQELPTALGTVVRFTRDGIEYTVLGSHPADTVISAARAL